MSKKNEFRKLLPDLEKLPDETREGLVKFLELLLTVNRSLETAHLDFQAEELVPVWGHDEKVTDEFRELLRLLGQRLQGQQPVRRDLVVAVLAASGKAYELGEGTTGRLLLQVAIVMTAGEEDVAAAEIQGTVCAAALAIAKGH